MIHIPTLPQLGFIGSPEAGFESNASFIQGKHFILELCP